MSNVLHEGDVGTAFTYYCKEGETVIDISTATVKVLKFVKPSGAKVSQTAYFGDGAGATGDGTEGVLAYDFVAGDLSTKGEWTVQGQITLGASDTRSYTEERFHVHEKL